MYILTFILSVSSFLLHCESIPLTGRQPVPYYGHSEAAFDTLQTWYNSSGLWTGTDWWNAANCITVIADLLAVDGNRRDQSESTFAQTFSDNKKGGFLNNFYDDQGWWALGWIAAYDVTKNSEYLQTAQSIFEDNTNGWKGNCTAGGVTGGMHWTKQPQGADGFYINAVTNELYISIAASLANRASDRDKYLSIAKQAWTWLSHVGMTNSDGLFNDGLNQDCTNNGQPVYTYNQGIILGGLVELFIATSDTSYLDSATKLADTYIGQFQSKNNGILTESCDPSTCDTTSAQFKGIFMRNLAKLYGLTRRQEFRDFITKNADSIWANDRIEQGMGQAANQLGSAYGGPYTGANPSTQSSAMDALIGAIAVSV